MAEDPQSLRLKIVSDDRLFCEGLCRIISATSPYTVTIIDEDAALRLPPDARNQILFVDSRLPDVLALCERVKARGGPPVILLAARPDEDWGIEALCAGVRGIVHKTCAAEDVVKAVEIVSKRQVWAPRRLVAAALMKQLDAAPTRRLANRVRLTSREHQVFRCAAAGLGNKEVASRLAISEATVKVHLTHIFRKLRLRGRAKLAAAYHGVAPPSDDRRKLATTNR